MAQAIDSITTSRFHNLSDAALADALGRADAALKGAEAECTALKDEFKRRGLSAAAGSNFTVTATGQFSTRLDTKAIREFLGDGCRRFEVATASIVIRIKAINRMAAAA
jgi:hypothetical protein